MQKFQKTICSLKTFNVCLHITPFQGKFLSIFTKLHPKKKNLVLTWMVSPMTSLEN